MRSPLGEFQLGVAPYDALVASADALDDLGWDVQSVGNRWIRAYGGAKEGDCELEVVLRDGGRGTTVVSLGTRGTDAISREITRELTRLRTAIEDAAPAALYEREALERRVEHRLHETDLAQEFREELRIRTVRDRRTARILRILAMALAVASTIVLAEAAVTLLWQEPLSYVYAQREQSELDNRLDGIEARYRRQVMPPTSAPRPKPLSSFPRLAARLASATDSGEPLGRLRIPAIGLDAIVVEDAEPTSLQKGPAHYAGTVLPGQHGTVGIAGHRTTYSAPFRDLDDMKRGDRVVLRMPYGVFTYGVEGKKVVSPEDVQVLNRVGHDRLTLTACHPLFSASERIAVFARLTGKKTTPTQRL